LVPKYHGFDLYLILALVLLTLSLGHLLMVPGVCGVYHDDGIYVITAKALAQGNGYRLINLPQAPFQSKYPIIFPALLAAIWKLWPIFPANVAAMQWLTLVSTGAFVGLAYLYMVTWGYATRPVAFLVGALTATSPIFLYYGILTLSEMPFACLMVALLFSLERYLVAPVKSRLGQLVLGAVLALPYLTRAIGVVFILAALAVIFFSKRRVFWVMVGTVVAALPWALWSFFAPKGNASIVMGWYTNYLTWWHHSTGLSVVAKIFFTNIILCCLNLVTYGLVALFQIMKVITQAWVWIVFFGLLSLIFLIREIKYRPVLPALLLSYLLLTLVWPWPPNRRLIVILPFLLLFLFNGLLCIVRLIPKLGKQRLLGLLCAGLLVSTNLVMTHRNYQANWKAGYPYLFVPETPAKWSSYQEIFRWVREHTQTSEVIAYGFDSMLYLYTGRKGFRPFVMRPNVLFYGGKASLGKIAELKKFLHVYRPGYLINTPMPGFSEEKPFTELLHKVQERYPGWFKMVFRGSDPRFIIFKVDPRMAPST
jgi:hypothetical protein